MLTKRIIPCLDVRDGLVVKGVQFKNHEVVGGIIDLARRYKEEGADELVFYDITASSQMRTVDKTWVELVAKNLDIPFCVAGGIRRLDDAKAVLNHGADKISINSPALENPDIITSFANVFGTQCVVIGIDSMYEDGDYYVYQYTGDEKKIRSTGRKTIDWVNEVQNRGAGEIVLNCMNQDGVRSGYDINQLSKIRQASKIPLIASGGAGTMNHFAEVFKISDVDGALAASVFHKGIIGIQELKDYLKSEGINIRK